MPGRAVTPRRSSDEAVGMPPEQTTTPSRETDPAWPQRPDGWRHDAPDPPDAFAVPFTALEALLLVLWSIVAQILVAIPLALAGFTYGQDVATMVVLIGVQLFVLGGALAWLRRRGKLSWRLLGPVRPAWRHVAIGLGIGVSGFVITAVIVEVVNRVFGPFEVPEQSLLESTSQGGATAVLGGLAAVVLAPVVEETIFRGALFQSIRSRIGLWPALVLSSMLFAIVHLEVFSAVSLVAFTVLGIWLAGAFHRTGSLVVPILGHAGFNGVVLAFALLAPDVGV